MDSLTDHSGEGRGAGTGGVVAKGRAKPLRVVEPEKPLNLDNGWDGVWMRVDE